MQHEADGEEQLHEIFRSAFRKRKGIQGPGHDCARILPPPGNGLVLTCDQVVRGIHVEEDASPSQIARKLLRRTLSDIAAAGATPWIVNWTIAAPTDLPLAWLKRLARAFLAEADLFGAAVIGGDVSASAELVCSCTAIGREGRRPAPGRSGAKPGQWLAVTGRLGNAVRSGKHLRPEPRLVEGRILVERYHATALMDLSDGLARDLPRLLAASKVGASIDLDAIPLDRALSHNKRGWQSAVAEGEDYELLAVLRPEFAKRAFFDPVLKRTGLHVIGELVPTPGIRWQVNGEVIDLPVSGWSHGWQ